MYYGTRQAQSQNPFLKEFKQNGKAREEFNKQADGTACVWLGGPKNNRFKLDVVLSTVIHNRYIQGAISDKSIVPPLATIPPQCCAYIAPG